MTRVVAISQRRDPTGPPHNEVRDALDHRLAEFVIAAGGLPVPVSSAISGKTLDEWLAQIQPDAVLLSGGADIGVDPVRDAVDFGFLEFAERHKLPLLGVCRGMQFMGHAGGATLRSVTGHVATRHALSGEITRSVNSYHAQALADVPVNYRLLARAPCGSIEAIRHTSLPWEGWMWHPEREATLNAADVDRFKRILS